MSDSIFNRPRRQIEPRQPDEHGRDFGDQSYAPDQGAAVRRDTVDDSLLSRAETDDFQHMYALSAAPVQSPGEHGHK